MAGGANRKRKTPCVGGRKKASGGSSGGGTGKKVNGGGGRGRAAPSKKRVKPREVEEEIEEVVEELEEEPLGDQGTEPPRNRRERDRVERFVDEFALKFYNDTFRGKTALIEKEVKQTKVNDDFWANLKARGWDSLLRVDPVSPNISLVREFFANAKSAGESNHYIFLRGRKLCITHDALAQHLHLPTIEFNDEYNQVFTRLSKQDPPVDVLEMVRQDICPNCQWIPKENDPKHSLYTSSWTPQQKLVLKFVTNRLYPTSQATTISAYLLKIIYAFIHNIPIDAAKIIKAKLASYIRKQRPNLIFPHLITDMARAIGIEKLDEDMLVRKKQPPITESSNLARHGAQHQAPPPPRQPAKAARSVLEQVNYSAHGSVRDWLNDNRMAMLSIRTIQDAVAAQHQIPTSHLPNVSATPYQYDSFVNQYVPGYSLNSFAFFPQPSVGEGSNVGNEGGEFEQGDVGGSGGGGEGGSDKNLDMIATLGTDLETEIDDGQDMEATPTQPKHGKGKNLATRFQGVHFVDRRTSETDDD